ncbi:hypothetical protein N6H14_20650 [Paenibacillus sp. CC-CFT747]|nr:hypothetical protein N6H14_20650 [Paenibacillus sp. CC-CFT747]
MRKPTIVFLGTSLALAATLSGCSSKTSAGDTDSPKPSAAAGTDVSAQPKKEVTVQFMRGEHPAQALKADTPVLKEIFAKTGVKIELQPVPGSNYEDKKDLNRDE